MSGGRSRRRRTVADALADLTPAQRAHLDAFAEVIRGRPQIEIAEIVAQLIDETIEAEVAERIAYRARWS